MHLGKEVSVVIPSLDEEVNLRRLLGELKGQRGVSLEVVVSDGGSRDATVALAERAGVTVVRAPRGRASQLNAGAAACSKPLILFLHADSLIPDENLLAKAVGSLQRYAQTSGNQRVAGHFGLKFDRQNPGNDFAYCYYESKSTLNRPGTNNGDQGFLMYREFFNELEGFDESLSFLEDQRLAEKIRIVGEWITLPGVLRTSARRFEREGFSRRMVLSAMIMALYRINLREFFERAPEIYRAQTESDWLQLSRFFKLIHQLLWGNGLRKCVSDWIGIGRYVRRNAWQLFYVIDVRNQFDRKRASNWLRFHDRFFAPATNFVVMDITSAVLTYAWFLIAWSYFSAKDR